MFIGYLIGFNISSAYTTFLFIGLGRAFQQQTTFCVNSLCHFVGNKKYCKGTAGNVWWFAPFLLGENWHNFHHAFATDYRNGTKWYHLDVHKWIIYLMSKLGLAWDLDCTSELRIEAKMQELLKSVTDQRRERLDFIHAKINELTECVKHTLTQIENSSATIKSKIASSYIEIQDSLSNLTKQLHSTIRITEKSSEKLLRMATKKIELLESSLSLLYKTTGTLLHPQSN